MVSLPGEFKTEGYARGDRYRPVAGLGAAKLNKHRSRHEDAVWFGFEARLYMGLVLLEGVGGFALGRAVELVWPCFLRGERTTKHVPPPCQGQAHPHYQRYQSHVQPGFKTKPDSSFVTDANLLAPMELEHRPCEAVLAGSCLWLRSKRYATGGLGAATEHVEFSRPQSSLVLSPRRKYNQTCSAALPRANPSTPPTVPVPCAV